MAAKLPRNRHAAAGNSPPTPHQPSRGHSPVEQTPIPRYHL
jgi:hypothetical protein